MLMEYSTIEQTDLEIYIPLTFPTTWILQIASRSIVTSTTLLRRPRLSTSRPSGRALIAAPRGAPMKSHYCHDERAREHERNVLAVQSGGQQATETDQTWMLARWESAKSEVELGSCRAVEPLVVHLALMAESTLFGCPAGPVGTASQNVLAASTMSWGVIDLRRWRSRGCRDFEKHLARYAAKSFLL